MYIRRSLSTIEVAPKKLAEFNVAEWESVYLRPLDDEDVERMLERNSARGKPGCIGSSIARTGSGPRAQRGLLGRTITSKSGAPFLWKWFMMRTLTAGIRGAAQP